MVASDGVSGNTPHLGVGAIIVAAGESRRMAGVDKVFTPLLGLPLISYSLKTLHDAPQVDAIVVVLAPPNLERGERLVKANDWHKVRCVVSGGRRRQDSVRLGLERLDGSEWIIVQDGARPFIDERMIATGLAQAAQTGAALAAVPVKDTIKLADADLYVSETLPRGTLWAAQTPQVFRRRILAEAHRRIEDEVTDDASMVERMGHRVRMFMGSYRNIKVTTPEDLSIAEAILKTRAAGASQRSQ